MRSNGIMHILKYLKTRQMSWGVILGNGIAPSMVHNYDEDVLKLYGERPGADANVCDLRTLLKDLTQRLMILNHNPLTITLTITITLTLILTITLTLTLTLTLTITLTT